MDFNTYQKKAHETAVYPTDIFFDYPNVDEKGERLDKRLSWVYPALGLSAETGELMNKLKKVIRDYNGEIKEDGHLSPMKDHICLATIVDELSDNLWYIAELCTRFGIKMDYVAEYNVNKLALRAMNDTIHGDNR